MERMEGKRAVEMSSSNSTSCLLSFGENSNGLMSMMMPHMSSHHHHHVDHHDHHSSSTEHIQTHPNALFLHPPLPPPPQEYRFNHQNNNNIASGSSMEFQNGVVEGSNVYASSSSSSSSVKAKIMAHPHYHRLLTAFVNCRKVGAPPEVVARLEEECASAAVGAVGSLGEDPALDQFMEAYCEMLIKYEQEISKPFKEAMLFLQRVESQLNSLSLSSSSLSGCSSEAAMDQRNNNRSSEESPAELVDPQAADGELKGQLLRKYSGYLGNLKQEFMKKRKKGKLPKEAREQLLEWWSRHYKWPYPSEQQKLALAETTGLDHKQINNWFINQRKRHWKPSEDMQFVVMDASSHPHFYFDNVLGSPFPMDHTTML